MRGKTSLKSRSLFLMLLLVFSVMFALPSVAAPRIKKAEYDGKGKVEIDFLGKVRYKNVKVSVTDNTGKKVRASIIERDDDELTIRLKSYKAGKTYTYWISGIRKRNENSYSTVTGKVKIPKASTSRIPIEEIEYDGEDREVSFSFRSRVQWKRPKVKIYYGKTNYAVEIIELDDDGIDVYVKRLKYGRNYRYQISGIRRAGSSKYVTISGTFRAIDS